MRSFLCAIASLGLFTSTACSKQDGAEAATLTTPIETTAPAASYPLADEAILLARHPGLARREGDHLTINYAGHELITYIDDPKACHPYSVTKVLQLYDTDLHSLQAVAEVTCHFGHLDNHYLVLPTSDKYPIIDDVWASPDGHWLAMADNAMGNQPTRGHFAIVSWPSLDKSAIFPAGCHVTAWADTDHVKATCWHNDGSSPSDADDSRSVFFAADITSDGKGHWQMQARQWLDPTSLKPVTSSRPLPKFSGLSFNAAAN